VSAVAAREREIKLPLGEWETRPTERGPEYQGVPGTWCDVRKVAGCPKGLIALVCCPACREVFALSDRVHTINANGRVTNGSVACTRGTCGFRALLVLERWNKKPLYGVAIERTMPDGSIKAEMHHTHADSKKEAIAQCANLGGRYRVVDAAPAVGYFVNPDGSVSAD
jgi:hypothetical protein